MKTHKGQVLQSRLEGAVFIGPALLAFLPVVAIPFLYSVVLSVMEWNGISDEITFVGLKNYIRILTTDADFKHAFWFTVRITAVSAVISNILGLFFAALLTKKLKIRNWGRTALLLPNIMSGVILGYIWQFIFTRAFPALGELLGWGVFQQARHAADSLLGHRHRKHLAMDRLHHDYLCRWHQLHQRGCAGGRHA